MNTNRITVREARKNISKLLASGKTVAVGHHYGELRGFIVGVPEHGAWNHDEKRKALKHAKARFTEAWIREYAD
jgi:hypothetical protein